MEQTRVYRWDLIAEWTLSGARANGMSIEEFADTYLTTVNYPGVEEVTIEEWDKEYWAGAE